MLEDLFKTFGEIYNPENIEKNRIEEIQNSTNNLDNEQQD